MSAQMEQYYIVMLAFLAVIAVIDLFVGVSNDASNFLNSALGCRIASFRTTMWVASLGVLLGATFSSGMMEVARPGIFHPQMFSFSEIMVVFFAVMVADVILLDAFNSLGLPTSTTVSIVFELLGSAAAAAWKLLDAGQSLGDLYTYINTSKSLGIVSGILISVVVAFISGAVIQYLARLLFSFRFEGMYKRIGAVYGAFSITAIIYFLVMKGAKGASFMRAEWIDWINANTSPILITLFVGFTILFQICISFFRINVFKIIILAGTFSLAFAFAGNDLVNFIGVPLAGYSSYMDLMAQGGTTTTDTFLMTSLLGPAQTPWYFLVGSGVVMVIALATSKKAQNVVKTSLDLSRQSDGEESFGTSPVARVLVRNCSNISATLLSIVPTPVKNWIDSRFNQSEMIMDDKASFDLVRASVNVVLSGLLIALGTSLKLPLSTTYVAFMVAMGTSLADRAWGRESAVYRITGVLSVIGGWFITAGAAFTICFIVALLIYWGGIPALVAMIGLAIYSLVRSHFAYKAKLRKEALKEEVNSTVSKLRKATDTREALALFREHSREELQSDLDFTAEVFGKAVNGFMNENLRELRKVLTAVEEKKIHLKQVKRVGTLGVTQLDHDIAVEKGLYYYQGNDFASEIIFSIRRLAEPMKDHIDNNFSPLSPVQKDDFGKVSEQIISFLRNCATMIRKNDYIGFEELIAESITLMNQLTALKKGELKRIQGQSGSTKVSMVYLNMVQEAQNVVSFTANLLKVSRKFQKE